jgi:UDP-glucose:(heptosyl)LPS alpha-1,3-glucosyltransferase
VRREIGIPRESTVALYVGDLTKSHTHLKAIASASPEVEFVIVTASPQYHWCSPNVHLLPARSDISRYYAAADAFIFPTTYDAFGMVVLEAMASGLAVFSSDRAGAAELISSGKDGFVIPLSEWVERTTAGLRDRDSLQTIGEEAHRTAAKHDWSTVIRNVEQVYTEVVAAESAPEVSKVSSSAYRYQQ